MKGRTVKRRRQKPEQSDPLNQRVVFCTTCGEKIENFCVSDAADDLKAIRKTLAQCKSHGRFNGDFCSKLFIAHPEAFEEDETGD